MVSHVAPCPHASGGTGLAAVTTANREVSTCLHASEDAWQTEVVIQLNMFFKTCFHATTFAIICCFVHQATNANLPESHRVLPPVTGALVTK